MENKNHECQILIDKSTDCSQVAELNAINYLSDFQILRNLDYIVNDTIDFIKLASEEPLKPKPEVCINLDNDDRVCVELALNEALSEPTKVIITTYFVTNKDEIDLFFDLSTPGA